MTAATVNRPFRVRASLVAVAALLAAGLAAFPGSAARAAAPGEPVVNEFSASTAGTDVEYLELLGPAGWDAALYRVLEIEGDAGTATGTVDEVAVVPAPDAEGRALVSLPANALENGTITLLVVKGFTGVLNADLDTNGDGLFDVTPWEAVVDAVAVNDGGLGDLTYGPPSLGVAYDGQPFAPGGASRIPDGADTDTAADWVRNDFDLAGLPGLPGSPVVGEALNTPGAQNVAVAAPSDTVVEVSAPVDTVTEGGPSAGIVVTRTGPTTDALAAEVALSGTASADDYTPVITSPVSIPAGAASVQIDVSAVDDDAVEGSETLTVTLLDTADYDLGTARAATITITDGDLAPCVAADTPIGTVQGTGETSPRVGQTVTVQGVVVADYEFSASLRGFYLQDGGDGDPATSDALFVFQSSDDDVALGDVVQAGGTVAEFQGQTQLNAASVIETCGQGGTVSPTSVSLPSSSATALESVEGMVVSFDQELAVTEHFQLGRFGQVVVSSGGRLAQPTSVVSPGGPALARQAENDLNRLIVDDDLQTQNPDPIKLARAGAPLSAGNTLRGGDTVTALTGVLTYTWSGNAASGNAYRLRPIGALGGSAIFQPANSRPVAAPVVGGTLRVSAFNVLNYFLTLDYPTGNPLDNTCGPANDVECRGADSSAELARQKAKLLPALAGLDADVLALVELENSAGVDPLNDPADGLVTGLNATVGAGTYAGIDTGVVGTDAIRVAIVYQPAAVRPVGAFEVIDGDDDARFRDALNRPALVQTFEEIATGERFTVVANHLKSKGSDCNAVGDPDLGDGQGNCNETRRLAAEAISDVLASMVATGDADPDVVVLGDLNSYAQEDPIVAFEDAGFVNLVERFGGPDAYSFAFDGQWGYLDHALASPSMNAQVVGAAEWHVNADEPAVLDYNTEFKSAAQQASLFAADPYRTSDHDPVVVGLDLAAPPRLELLGNQGVCTSDTSISLRVRVSDPDDAVSNLSVTASGSGAAVVPGSVTLSGQGSVRTLSLRLTSPEAPTQGTVTVTASDATASVTLTARVLVGSNNTDVLDVAPEASWVVVGRGGADRITGGDQGDLLCGGRGDDILAGLGGDDTMVGERGADTLEGGQGADAYDGGAGTDTFVGLDLAEGDVVRSR